MEIRTNLQNKFKVLEKIKNTEAIDNTISSLVKDIAKNVEPESSGANEIDLEILKMQELNKQINIILDEIDEITDFSTENKRNAIRSIIRNTCSQKESSPIKAVKKTMPTISRDYFSTKQVWDDEWTNLFNTLDEFEKDFKNGKEISWVNFADDVYSGRNINITST